MKKQSKQTKTQQTSSLDNTVQLLIPPSLVLLLVFTIIDLFYGFGKFAILIDIFDLYVIAIFAIDLHFRWKETKNIALFFKKHTLDILATIPFNFIFYGLQGLTLLRAFRGIRFLTQITKYTKLLRVVRFTTRAPRFIKLHKHVKKADLKKKAPHEKEMKSVLSFKVILLITINSIMGTGIYFLTAAGAKHAGPASLISWGILSLISLYIAMCFSELCAMFPKAGGVYEFAKQAYGRFASFVIGWTTAIAGSVTIAMLLLGSLQYLIPAYPKFYIPVAFALIILFNYIAYRGMQTSTIMLVSFALVTLGTVLALIIPGLFNFSAANFEPFFVFPAFSVILTIFFIAETFFGWESAVFLSAETKNPTKVMPKALIWGTIVIAILAFFLSLSAMGVIPWEKYGNAIAPLRDLGGALFGAPGSIVFTILVFISIIGAVACWVVTAPRLLMSIAEDRLFFVHFAKIHPKHKSPYVSIGFQTIVLGVLVVIGAGSYMTLLHMLLPLILLTYIAVLMSVVVLRFKHPNFKRPYKVPFGRIGPIITAIFMLFLLAMFVFETHGALHILKISGSLILFGIPAYFFIELFYDPKYVVLRRDMYFKVLHLFNKLPKANPVYKKIIKYISPIDKKSVIIDYNSPVASLSRFILKKHEFKKIHTMHTSHEAVSHLHGTLHHKQINIHQVQHGHIPSKIKTADVFISYNDLGYVGNMDKFLKHVSSVLSKKGKFCFFVTQHFFNVAPNALFLENNEAIKKLFKKHKLNVEIKRHKRPLHENIFIYGTKK